MIRENFLTRIFTLADFREVRESGDFNDLIDFQTRNKLLLLSYNQEYARKMGNLLSNRTEYLIHECQGTKKKIQNRQLRWKGEQQRTLKPII